MKYLLPLILLISIAAGAQQLQRYDSFAATTTSASGIGNLTQVIPNATITVFNYPGVGVSCAGGGCVAATTYTSGTGGTACGGGLPLTRPTSNTCLSTADSQGNFGFWASSGNYQYCVAATNFTTQCYNTILGVGFVNNINNIFYVDGVKYPTVGSAVTAANALSGSSAVIVPPGLASSAYVISSTMALGTGFVTGPFQSTALILEGGAWLSCTITNNTPCIQVFNSSAVIGRQPMFGNLGGLSYPSNVGSSGIQLSSTAAVSSVITMGVLSGATHQQNVFLKDFIVMGTTGATVSGAAIDITGIADQSVFDNFAVFYINGTLLRVWANNVSGNTGACCGITFRNIWLDGGNLTSAKPLFITAASTAAQVAGVSFFGGSITASGAGIPLIEINGNGGINVHDIAFYGLHMERDTSDSILVKIRDAFNITFDSLETTDAQTATAADLFNLSQSASSLTHDIILRGIDASPSTGSTWNTVNDTISTLTPTLGVTTAATLITPEYTFFGKDNYKICSSGTGGGCLWFGNTGQPTATLQNFDFGTALTLQSKTATSSLSANLQFKDNQASPQSWIMRKSNAQLLYVSPAGGTIFLGDPGAITSTGMGFPVIVASSGAITIGSGTSIAATSLCSTTQCPAGRYQVQVYIDITTACTTTGTYIPWLGYTDDQGAKAGSSTTTYFSAAGGLGVTPATATTGATLGLASTANFLTGTYFLTTTGAATGGLGAINYGTTATACGTGGPMVGKMYFDVTRLE